MRNMAGGFGFLVMSLLLTGCNFFVDPNATTTSTSSAGTGDYVYVINSAANTLSGYVVGTSTLTAISGVASLPLQTGLSARSIAVTRANTFLYIGGDGAISCFAIGTGGVLTAVTGALVGTEDIVSLDTSPDGQWLLAVDAFGRTVNVYGINASTGALSGPTQAALNVALTSAVSTPVVKVQPVSANTVLVSANSGGTAAFSFNTSTGAIAYVGLVQAVNLSDNGVAFDATGSYAYVVRADTTGTGTSGISAFTVAGNGIINGNSTLIATGSAPSYLAFDKSGKYLYVANKGPSTISGFTLSGGTLTAPAAYSSSGQLQQLIPDNSGSYMLGVNVSGTSDVSLYPLDTSTAGKLDAAVTVSTGTPGVIALAATH